MCVCFCVKMYFLLEYKLGKNRDFIYFVLCSVLSILNSGCHIVGAQLIFVERMIEGRLFLHLSECYIVFKQQTKKMAKRSEPSYKTLAPCIPS